MFSNNRCFNVAGSGCALGLMGIKKRADLISAEFSHGSVCVSQCHMNEIISPVEDCISASSGSYLAALIVVHVLYSQVWHESMIIPSLLVCFAKLRSSLIGKVPDIENVS